MKSYQSYGVMRYYALACHGLKVVKCRQLVLVMFWMLGVFCTSPLTAQQTTASKAELPGTVIDDPTYNSQVFVLDLKWRRNLEANLRWMIHRERQADATVPVVGIYADAGTKHLGTRNVVESLESEGIRCRVLDRTRILPEELRRLRAYIVPGGYSTFQNTATGTPGLNAIREFVEKGGRYLGICAGAYLASRDVYWEGEHYPYPLELFDGTAQGALENVAIWPEESGVSVTLTEKGTQRGLTAEAEGDFYYKGGPRFYGGSDYSVLARYPDNTAAIISRKYGYGEVILSGIHFERPSPEDQGDDEDPAPPEASRKVFPPLLKLATLAEKSESEKVARSLTRWTTVTDLALEDRLNLEQNLRWILARTIEEKISSFPVRVGVFADAGVEHGSLVEIYESLTAHDITVELLLHTDVRETRLKSINTFIIPAGNHRILRDTLAVSGQDALQKFVESGGQFIGLSTGAYLASGTIRWLERTWEYPIRLHTGIAEGPLLELASWPYSTSTGLSVTASGSERGLTAVLLSRCRYHGGPRFYGPGEHDILARYPDGTAAIITRDIGKGEMVLIGVDLARESRIQEETSFLLHLLSK